MRFKPSFYWLMLALGGVGVGLWLLSRQGVVVSGGGVSSGGLVIKKRQEASFASIGSVGEGEKLSESKGNEVMSVSGQAFLGRAVLEWGGQRVEERAGPMGIYGQRELKKKERIKIRAMFDHAVAGEKVTMTAEDGGWINPGKGGESTVRVGELDEAGGINFEFQTDELVGIYRVSVRRGLEEQQFHFWVNP